MLAIDSYAPTIIIIHVLDPIFGNYGRDHLTRNLIHMATVTPGTDAEFSGLMSTLYLNLGGIR